MEADKSQQFINFISKHPKYLKGGEMDSEGFYTQPDGSFFDYEGVYFNPAGYDEFGGYYDDNGEYVEDFGGEGGEYDEGNEGGYESKAGRWNEEEEYERQAEIDNHLLMIETAHAGSELTAILENLPYYAKDLDVVEELKRRGIDPAKVQAKRDGTGRLFRAVITLKNKEEAKNLMRLHGSIFLERRVRVKFPDLIEDHDEDSQPPAAAIEPEKDAPKAPAPHISPPVSEKPEAKAVVKPEAKAVVKPEAKAAAKPEDKPELKPEVKPELKPEVKPEPKPEVKPEPKAVVKVPSNPEENKAKPAATKTDQSTDPAASMKKEEKKTTTEKPPIEIRPGEDGSYWSAMSPEALVNLVMSGENVTTTQLRDVPSTKLPRKKSEKKPDQPQETGGAASKKYPKGGKQYAKKQKK